MACQGIPVPSLVSKCPEETEELSVRNNSHRKARAHFHSLSWSDAPEKRSPPKASVYASIYIYVYIYICKYLSSKWRRSPSPCIYQAFIRCVFACVARWATGKYLRTFHHNTKPEKSLRRTFSKRNSRTKELPNNKMATPGGFCLPGLKSSLLPFRRLLKERKFFTEIFKKDNIAYKLK